MPILGAHAVTARHTFCGVSGDVGELLTGSLLLLFLSMLFLMDQSEMKTILLKWYRPSPMNTAMARNTCTHRSLCKVFSSHQGGSLMALYILPMSDSRFWISSWMVTSCPPWEPC